jgi:hypothetical protein
MNTHNKNSRTKIRAGEKAVEKPKPRKTKLSRMARGALLAMGLTAAQLGEEADFFGDKVFSRNLVDRLHSTALTRYHE